MLRPLRYESVDGSGEIGWGLALLGFAMSGYAHILLPGPSPWRSVASWAFLAAAAVAPLVARHAIKRWITWPRTGYVGYRRAARSFWVAIVGSGVVAASLGLALPFLMKRSVGDPSPLPSPDGLTVSSGTAGWMCATLFALPNVILYWQFNTGLTRGKPAWKWVFMGLIGFIPYALVASKEGGFLDLARPVMLSLGSVWLASGCLTLGLYLRRTQPPSMDAA